MRYTMWDSCIRAKTIPVPNTTYQTLVSLYVYSCGGHLCRCSSSRRWSTLRNALSRSAVAVSRDVCSMHICAAMYLNLTTICSGSRAYKSSSLYIYKTHLVAFYYPQSGIRCAFAGWITKWVTLEQHIFKYSCGVNSKTHIVFMLIGQRWQNGTCLFT